jgi:hypothetical protein
MGPPSPIGPLVAPFSARLTLYTEDGGSRFLRNVGTYYTTQRHTVWGIENPTSQPMLHCILRLLPFILGSNSRVKSSTNFREVTPCSFMNVHLYQKIGVTSQMRVFLIVMLNNSVGHPRPYE